MTGRLFLIDGHALIFKMYYAFLRRPMINSKGMDTSILFGFTKYLLELIDKEQPTHLAVAFDPPGGTFRNQLYPEYKANRAETPQLVIDALEPLTGLCESFNIPVLMIPGFEADDVIGSMAKRCAREGLDVYMVTPDKDYGQLVEPRIHQIKPGRAGEENELLGVPEICAKYGISSPQQVIDMLAICGDVSDNVPGVKGVGEVGASKLISKYGSVEQIYAHLDELSDRQRAMFEDARGHIGLSKSLVTIKTDVDLSHVTTDSMKMDLSYDPSVAGLFEKYEFNSLYRYISHIAVPVEEVADKTIPVVEIDSASISVFAEKAGRMAVETVPETSGIFSPVSSVVVSVSDGKNCSVSKGTPSDFKDILEDESVEKCGINLKYQINVLHTAGVRMKGPLADVELMHYILNPERSHSIEILAKQYLGVTLAKPETAAVQTSLFIDEEEERADDISYLYQKTAAISLLASGIIKQMEQVGLKELYDTIEEPLIQVLARMERTGVKVDAAALREFAGTLRAEMAVREARVKELAGEPALNISSPKQLGEVLFEKLKLDPRAKKSSKGSWSTDEDTLLALSDKSPIIDAILEYRGLRKLLSTYIEPFPGYISPVTGRIHTTFNQALTSTGRLSSSNPNLQNIPIRTERGKEIRRAFVPGLPGAEIMSADYSQIELRIMAHLSADAHMTAAFREGIDVHSATAAKIFGIPVEEVTPDQRRIAKTANFGIMYGISPFGLAQRLKIPRSDAKKVIDEYFTSFPAISSFINHTLESARENGYVETIFGRRRYISDINAHNATVRSLAERNAVNAPIQGTSADIIKIAMTRIDRRIQAEGLRSLMVLQIHDELLFEVVPEEKEIMRSIVVSEMENVIKLSVPLTVECNYGKNWLESH